MKHLLFIIITIGIISCNNSRKENNAISTIDSTNVLVPIKANLIYPLSVDYSGPIGQDTMYLNLNNEKLRITRHGEAFNNKDSLLFDLKLEYYIENIYIQKIDDDLVAIFVESDGDGAGGCAKRISLNSNEILWSKHFGGFNMHQPVIIDNYAYLSTIGFIGKLDLNNGEFKWKFENLYDKGKYNSFEEPVFFENNKVLFLSKMHNKSVFDSILVDDERGKILKIN